MVGVGCMQFCWGNGHVSAAEWKGARSQLKLMPCSNKMSLCTVHGLPSNRFITQLRDRIISSNSDAELFRFGLLLLMSEVTKNRPCQ